MLDFRFRGLTPLAGFLAVLVLSGVFAACAHAEEKGLAAAVFDKSFDMKLLKGRDIKERCRVLDGLLHVSMPAGSSSSIEINFNKPTDLSACRYLLTDVRNTGPETLVLRMYVRDSAAGNYDSWGNYTFGVVVVRPGETKPLAASLEGPRPQYEYMNKYFPKMARIPGMFELNFWRTINASKVSAVRLISWDSDKTGCSFSLSSIRGAALISTPLETDLKAGKYFPFIDKYGQYNKADWPDKIRSDRDLGAMRKKENDRLASMPAMPTGWNRYGGWAAGPKLKATGHFRTEKYDGKWWLVDPDGCLFWSKGTTGLGFSIGGRTPMSPDARRSFFEDVSAVTTNEKGEKELTVGRQIESLKYGKQNGDQWKDVLTIRRAFSFGLNTAGAWSTVKSTKTHSIPYTLLIHTWSSQFSERLADPFDPSFRKNVDKSIAGTIDSAAKDPWCIGYFINNEQHWVPAVYLGKKALEHDPQQAAKKVLVDQLKASYLTIDKLNKAWGRSFSSWDDVIMTRNAGEINDACKKDLTLFGEKFCDTFFRTINELMDKHAPRKLYLGDRFNKNVVDAIKACSRYADVVSFNKYELGVENLRLPDGSDDRPIMIGEFCFVRGGRRHDSTCLGEVFDTEYRGRAYAQYIKGALQNPAIVGCHWFQWTTQPVSGRGDGENYENGFIDACDTPYWRLADYSRDLATYMYDIRLRKKSAFDYNPKTP